MMKETDLNELQARWPLFQYEERKNYHTGGIGYTVWLSPRNDTDHGNMSTHVTGMILDVTVASLDNYHDVLEIRNRYHANYPNLWFYIDSTKLLPTDVWVRRDGRDSEGISVTPSDLLNVNFLHRLNQEVGKALQDDWFWCFKCSEAKPKSEYGYFYFSAELCRKCKNADPVAYKRAMAESYN